VIKALLGDYPVTHAFRSGAIRSPRLEFDFADVKLPQQAFKRVVRELEFDFAELALVTYLLAKAHGKPYRLLPAVVTARFQHPYLVCLAKNRFKPKDLEGKRIGQRSYSVTTAAWIRGMLAEEGVDLSALSRRYGVDARRRFAAAWERAREAGSIVESADRVALTASGRLRSNDLFADLLGEGPSL